MMSQPTAADIEAVRERVRAKTTGLSASDIKMAGFGPVGEDNTHAPGLKFDAGKPPVVRGVLQYFPRALEAVAEISAAGAEKYTWNGWQSVPDGVVRYGDAMGRHILGEATDGPIDPESGLLHAAQVAWNALARLELMLRDRATDINYEKYRWLLREPKSGE